MRDLYRCFCYSMHLRFGAYGDTIIRTDGVPIGGVLSKSAASSVLGHWEHMWQTSNEWRKMFNLDFGTSWASTICCIRYVDDVLFISFAI